MTADARNEARGSAVTAGWLLIDSGNSRVKWARATAAGLERSHAVAREHWIADDALRDALTAPLSRVIIANVAGPTMAQELTQLVRARSSLEPEFVKVTAAAAGVRNAYADPSRLGVDRWVAMIAAWTQQRGAAVCVVDVGTAMTVDAVDAGGQHLGGLITPGPALMVSELLVRTGDLAAFARDGVARTDRLFADNTLGAMRQGSVHALAALVDRCMHHLTVDRRLDAKLIVTGGAAQLVLPHISGPATEDPDLVLRGLAVLAERY